MEGFNATIFAYGQSGSGKTFSMLGPEQVTEMLVNQSSDLTPEIEALFGIVPRATFQIFQLVDAGKLQGTKFTIKVNYIEIYNECINDILAMPPEQNLKIREFPNIGMCVLGMHDIVVDSPESVFECLSTGTANKIVCSTGQNSRSSRSHTVFIVTCEQVLLDGSVKSSKINLVDLAGSEKLSKTHAQGQALKEAQKINLSLTTLGRCIKALTSKTSEHIPYRESKLTLILKESLGGNSKTTLIVTGSMRKVHEDETLGTLLFAERAKLVKTTAKTNIKRSTEELELIIEQMKNEVLKLNTLLKEGGGSIIQDSTEFEELKIKYMTMQNSSTKQIEELTDALNRAKSSGPTADYQQERALLKQMLEQSSVQIEKLLIEKDTEKKAYEDFIEEIAQKNSEYQNKIFEITQELSSCKKFVGNLEVEISVRDELLNEMSQEKKKLLIEQNEYKNMLIETKTHILILETKKKNLESENHEMALKLQESMTAKTEFDLVIDKFEYYTQNLLNEIETLKIANNQHLQKSEELKSHMKTLQKDHEDLKLKCKELEKPKNNESFVEFQSMLAENVKLKLEIRQKTKELETMHMKTDTKGQSADDIISKLNIELDQALAEKAEIINDLQDFKQEYDLYQNTCKDVYKECQELKQLVSVLTQTNEILQNDLAAEGQNSAKLQKSIKFHEDTREKLIKDIENSVKVKMQLNINAFVKQINELQECLQDRESEVKMLKNTNKQDWNQLNSDLEDSKMKITSLNGQIKAINDEFNSKISSLAQEIESLKDANAYKMSENFHLKMDISERDSKIYKLNNQVQELETIVSRYTPEAGGKNDSPSKNSLFQHRKKAEKMTHEMIKSLYANIDQIPESE